MQYYKRARTIEDGATLGEILELALCTVKHGVTHRHDRSIPGILKAQDVFVQEDGHLVIKNPSKPYRPAY